MSFATTPVSSVTLTTTFDQPTEGWPAAVTDAFGIRFQPERITITATATEGGTEVLDQVTISGHLAGDTSTSTIVISHHEVPDYVAELKRSAATAAATALAVA